MSHHNKSAQKMSPDSLPENVPVVTAPIEAVSVSEDRAEIRRRVDLQWKKGPGSVFIDDITPLTCDRSLSSRFEGPSTPDIGNSRVLRYYVSPGGDHRKAEQVFLEKLDALVETYFMLVDEKTLARHKMAAMNKAIQETRETLLREIVHGKADPTALKPLVESLLNGFSQVLARGLDWRFEMEDLIERLKILVREAEEDPALIGKRAGVMVNYQADQDGRGTLLLSYEVPCAQWRPFHEAHLFDEGDAAEHVLLLTHGMVWQKTGEDWNHVKITLSTARPSLGMDMPHPAEEYLQVREKTHEERKQVRVTLRDQVVRDTGPDKDRGPGVPEDGGQTQSYSSPDRVTIPADGKPHMVTLSRTRSHSRSSHVAAGELSDRIFLRSRLKAPATPILAGPVELYRGGGFVGRGFLNFVGPGEPFHLDWGSDDFIQLVRWVDTKVETAGLLSKPGQTYTVNVLVRNLENAPVRFALTERLPVSELEQVVVEIQELPGKSHPDADGFVTLEVNVKPHSEEKLIFKYSLVMDKNVTMA